MNGVKQKNLTLFFVNGTLRRLKEKEGKLYG